MIGGARKSHPPEQKNRQIWNGKGKLSERFYKFMAYDSVLLEDFNLPASISLARKEAWTRHTTHHQ